MTSFADGLTPKASSKAILRSNNVKTETKIRGSQLSNLQQETTNSSYNNNHYGMVDVGSAEAATSSSMVAPTGNARYLTAADHTPPEAASPLIAGHQSQSNYRHNRVQSNIVESFNARATSQSALGLSNVAQQASGPTAPKTRTSIPTSKTKKANTTLTQQQQIQEKIKQLQMKEQLNGSN